EHGHLLARPVAVLGLLADQVVANEVADRLAPRRVALGRVAAVEGLQQGALQRYADARQFRHGSVLLSACCPLAAIVPRTTDHGQTETLPCGPPGLPVPLPRQRGPDGRLRPRGSDVPPHRAPGRMPACASLSARGSRAGTCTAPT